jgi:hypothetical protein
MELDVAFLETGPSLLQGKKKTESTRSPGHTSRRAGSYISLREIRQNFQLKFCVEAEAAWFILQQV